MIFRQPFAQAWRQQQLLLRQVGSVALWHKTLCNGSVHFQPANLRIPVGALSGAGRYYSDRLLELRASQYEESLAGRKAMCDSRSWQSFSDCTGTLYSSTAPIAGPDNRASRLPLGRSPVRPCSALRHQDGGILYEDKFLRCLSAK